MLNGQKPIDRLVIFCLGFTEQYSNNSDSVRFISSVFHFILPGNNKEAGRLLAQQGLLPFRAQVYVTEREEEARWRRGPNILTVVLICRRGQTNGM